MLAANFSCDSVNCSGHGQCDPSRAGGVDHACVCDDGWDVVTNCSSTLNCDALAGCSGHGICAKGGQWPCPTNQTSPCCLCDLGWSGPSCAVGECEFPIPARAHWAVLRGIFLALEESGPLASPSHKLMKMLDLGAAGPRGCSGHGECIRTTGKCLCDPMWNVVPSCSARGCASNCTHGTCVDGTCECNPGFAGAACEIYTCLNGCSGHGKCRLFRAPCLC